MANEDSDNFEGSKFLTKEAHNKDYDGLNRRIEAVENFLTGGFTTNEKIADTLFEASKKATRMQEMFKDSFLTLLSQDKDIADRMQLLIDNSDRNKFRFFLSTTGTLLFNLLSFILGAIVVAAINKWFG